VETVLGRRLRKEHSAVDWSTRPLPQPWLEYAALDVEALLELRDVLAEQLEASGKAEWARQEFDALVRSTPAARRIEPWRRTSGLHRAQGRRALAAVRALWETRDSIASARDVSPTRILPDSSIVEAATRMPADRSALIGLKGFRGRGAERYASRWIQALVTARGLPDQELPGVTGRYDGPPPVRAWVDREPVAAARLAVARDLLKQVAHSLDLPVENLLTPDHVRRLMWEPPEIGDVEVTQDRVAERLRQLGAREWQVELTAEPLTQAILSGPASRAPDADSDPGLDLTDETSPEA
jgi:ribonuclease D